MLTVHHLGKSQSERIVWLCEELQLPYALKRYDRTAAMAGPPEYKALHPLGAAPVITDGDILLAESGAIVDYILGKYGEGRLAAATSDANFADYLYWLHFVNGTLQPMLGRNLMLAYVAPADNPILLAMINKFEQALGSVETRLGQALYLAGDALSAADIMIVFTLTTMRYFTPFDLDAYPNILAYLQRIAARPAYRNAMAKGDPVMPLLLT